MKLEDFEKILADNIGDLQKETKGTGKAFIILTNDGTEKGTLSISGEHMTVLNMAINLLDKLAHDAPTELVLIGINELLEKLAKEKGWEYEDEHEEENHGIYS